MDVRQLEQIFIQKQEEYKRKTEQINQLKNSKSVLVQLINTEIEKSSLGLTKIDDNITVEELTAIYNNILQKENLIKERVVKELNLNV